MGVGVERNKSNLDDFEALINTFYNNDNTFMTQYYDPDSVQNISKPTDQISNKSTKSITKIFVKKPLLFSNQTNMFNQSPFINGDSMFNN